MAKDSRARTNVTADHILEKEEATYYVENTEDRDKTMIKMKKSELNVNVVAAGAR